MMIRSNIRITIIIISWDRQRGSMCRRVIRSMGMCVDGVVLRSHYYCILFLRAVFVLFESRVCTRLIIRLSIRSRIMNRRRSRIRVRLSIRIRRSIHACIRISRMPMVFRSSSYRSYHHG